MRVTYTSARGQSIVFARDSRAEHRIRDIQGLGGSDVETQMQAAPFQDGSTYLDTYMDPREISIPFSLFGDRQTLDQKRREFARVFNPKLGLGTLQVTTDNREDYVIQCIADGAPRFAKGGTEGFVKHNSEITLIAPEPYWKSLRTEERPMTAYLGMWEFPFSFPVEFGQMGDFVYLENDGDVDCPVVIKFRGPAVNPRIENATTGEFIQINRELSETQTLVINTSMGRDKTIEIVNQDGTKEVAWNWIDYESSLFNLVPGTNELSYSADEGADEATVTISYQKRYVGI